MPIQMSNTLMQFIKRKVGKMQDTSTESEASNAQPQANVEKSAYELSLTIAKNLERMNLYQIHVSLRFLQIGIRLLDVEMIRRTSIQNGSRT